MKSIEVTVSLREKLGKKFATNLRKKEHVPCVLYGNKFENIHFYAHENEFRKIVYTPNIYLITLNIEGQKHLAVLKDIQFHPVTDKVVHLDFYKVNEKDPVKVAVPVRLVGFAKGVQEGGKLKLESRKLNVRGLLNNIPDELVVNVENLELGKVIKVKELNFDNIEFTDSPNTVVASVKLTRVAKGMEAGEDEIVSDEAAEEGTAEGDQEKSEEQAES